MRNPNRLDSFYEMMKEMHKQNFPDWRFGQLMSNFMSWLGRDIFYLEEDDFIEKFAAFVSELKPQSYRK